MLVHASEIVESLEEGTYQKKKVERNDWYAYRCGDDTDGYGYAGGHECEADNCADDAACKFEYKRYDAPDGVERPEGSAYSSFFVIWHCSILVCYFFLFFSRGFLCRLRAGSL